LEPAAADLARAFYLTAAIGEGQRILCPIQKKEGSKDPRDWEKWAVGVRDGALELAEAFQHKQFDRIPQTARKVEDYCINCHDKFRD
jgi:hypothetical protein